VTIPGKGGRPRKWRSDADRSRAYRARQRGDHEPSTIEQALDDGDELAEARREIERLSLALREGRIERRALRAIIERREREIVLLDERLQHLRQVLGESWHERMELRRQCDELRAELNRASQGVRARHVPTPPVLPRHLRRQLEREQSRRGHNA
jgi:chromosome segregation ATPase